MHCEPTQQHQWLSQLLGQWTIESECVMGPDQPPVRGRGSETVRSLGGMWIVAEGQMEMPEAGVGLTMMTIGYDPARNRYPGTWVGSMMTTMWVYDGELDASGKVLTLHTEGPDFSTGKTTKFRDVIEIVSADHRILRSHMLQADGQWLSFMKADYRRVK